MRTFAQLRPAAKTYVSTIVVVGFAAVLESLISLYLTPVALEWLVLAALTLLTGSFTIKVPSINARLTVSETFVFASVLLFGVAAGTLTVVLETLVVALWTNREVRSTYHALFNVSASSLSIWIAATVFFAISGFEPLFNRNTPLGVLFGPLAILTIIFFVSNSWLVAIAVGLEKNQSPPEIWWKNFKWLAVNYFSGASVAAVLVTYSNTLTARALFGSLVIIVPLLLVSYLTFRTAMGRVEDSNQHLGQLNRLYLSTIETLAMAIDAKDQVTHGHIRRVQAHATSLAHEVGVRDEGLLKAIEAAALLHDMGKLAVPEHILNKPGKLTAAEFDKMKLHASVGADILSAIEFPYPVVPIVRHHHENWDGTGYPSGIKGTDIPIGARILSVVDCFDALTSDRPYRPKLSDADALAILKERRGTMYDPMIVDTFFRVHGTTLREPLPKGPTSEVLNTIAYSRRATATEQPSATLHEITASADEMLTLYELARALAGQVSVGDAGDVIAKHLRRLIPSALCVFYLYDSAIDELEAQHAVGDGAVAVRGMRIPLGQRLSGWVAANRQTISNSDPALDLYDAALGHSVKLKSCISTALLAEDALVGVLTLYSAEVKGFNDDHRRIIEAIARQIAHTFKGARDFEGASRRDLLTGLPSLRQLEQFVDAAGAHYLGQGSAFTLLFIDVVGLEQINLAHGRSVGDEVLRHVVHYSTAGLRLADILFRYGSDEFVALLNDTTSETAALVADRIRDGIRGTPFVIHNDDSIVIDVLVAYVISPSDGKSLASLIDTARLRNRAASSSQHDSLAITSSRTES
jgi:diguanylate cyclase (GGDEF)-like protein/putative nucleotidyltransferase with HDIG domain